MKFKINTKIAANAVSNARSVIVSKNMIPILADLYWKYLLGSFYITAFDGDNSVKIKLTADNVESPCDFCINAETLDNALKSLRDDEIIFETDEKSLTIRHKKGRLVLPLDKAEEYPEILVPKAESNTITVSGEMMRKIAEKGRLFTGNSQLRPAMNTILLETKENTLYAVASDAHKLIKLEYGGVTATNGDFATMMPSKIIALIPKLFADKTNITIRQDGMRTLLYDDGVGATLTYKNIDGTYPNWRSIMPKPEDCPNKIKANRDDMIDSLQRLCVINANTGLVKLSVNSDNQLCMRGENLDRQCDGDENMGVEFSGLANSQIGMKADNLIDGLLAYDTEDVIICIRDETKACMILSIDEADKTEVIIMPMRLNS